MKSYSPDEARAVMDAERRWLDRTAMRMTPADRLRLAVQRSEELELRSAEATEFLADAIDRFNAALAAGVQDGQRPSEEIGGTPRVGDRGAWE